jgi:hypothetical protein
MHVIRPSGGFESHREAVRFDTEPIASMKPNQRDIDNRIIHRYTDQPSALPAELRARIERTWGGSPVQLYATRTSILPATRETWVALGPTHRESYASCVRATIRVFERARITSVHEAPGLSATLLTVVGEPGEAPLAQLRYTNRQRPAFENLRFVITEQLEGRIVAPVDADREYAESVARPIRDTQSLVAGRTGGALFRLLRYLLPYRRQLTLGMAAATVITLVSMAPPYIAGLLIDRVIRPAQQGTLPLERAATIAGLAVAAMAVVHLIRQFAALVRLRLMAILGEWVARDLRGELYQHMQQLSLSFFARKKTGGLITRVAADTDRLWEFLAFGVVDVSFSLVMLVGLSIVLLTLDWRSSWP